MLVMGALYLGLWMMGQKPYGGRQVGTCYYSPVGLTLSILPLPPTVLHSEAGMSEVVLSGQEPKLEGQGPFPLAGGDRRLLQIPSKAPTHHYSCSGMEAGWGRGEDRDLH